ncbi:MAG: N-acetyl-gamma-glutamyl-phosphate reductase [Acidobacteriota bacterium]
MVRVGVAGGSGYGGAELIHILLRHPHVTLEWLSSQQHVGKRVGELYPNLRKLTDLSFSALRDLPASDLEVLFLALPHGQAMNVVPDLPDDLLIIDLSGDFRIDDPEIFQEYYGIPQTCPDVQKQFAYGLTEINRERIRSALKIANPGCFASATLLALYPLFKEKWIKGPVFVDSKTGSSGAGSTPGTGTHHPRRSNSLFAYKPFSHQHLPEIRQVLGEGDDSLVFQTYSAPFVRGIFASHYMELKAPARGEEVKALFEQYYGSDYFIRWVPDSPDVNYVRHSNFVDIGAAAQGQRLIVWSALDNLQKGAAGQAVQNMNVACRFPEQAGLEAAPVHP